MDKVFIDREKCIACGACGAIAPELFFVPPGHKSLFKVDFKVISKETNDYIYVVRFDKENNKIIIKDSEEKEVKKEIDLSDFEKGMVELSEFLGENVILERIIDDELKEPAEMGENACPVTAIYSEKN